MPVIDPEQPVFFDVTYVNRMVNPTASALTPVWTFAPAHVAADTPARGGGALRRRASRPSERSPAGLLRFHQISLRRRSRG